ncbi:MAG TPA: hypothetical protein VGT24_08180 [Candidatus Acidoferrales bacterium]|nr:hypothetical protein [Candidatus Acidoferrales bacterium]
MNHLETLLMCLTVASEVLLCGFVFARRAQEVLPFFAAYTSTLLAASLGLWVVYRTFGFQSQAGYYYYWTSLLINAVMRSLAIAELCRYKLRFYRGIWGLVWRLLIVLSMVFILHAAFDTWGQPNRLAIYSLTLNRDLAISSVGILAALLLIHNYYGLSLEPLQKTIAAGICFVSAMDVVSDTILRTLLTGYLLPLFTASRTSLWFALKPYYDRVSDLWSTIYLICFMAAMGIWGYALRRPIPAPAKAPVLLSAEVYRKLSPAINLRLSAFNDRLVELLKP